MRQKEMHTGQREIKHIKCTVFNSLSMTNIEFLKRVKNIFVKVEKVMVF